MKSTIQDKTRLVNSVFSKVYKKYDLMNDVMSLGIHRIWKDKLIDWMNPSRDSSLIDVASGTGDIAKRFSLRHQNLSTVTCIEPNEDMFNEGKKNLTNFKNIKWSVSKKKSINDVHKIGDIIFTGTPAGVGQVQAGDILKGYIENEEFFNIKVK